MVGEVEGGRRRRPARGERDDVATTRADRIIEISPEPAATRRIGHELTLQDAKPRLTGLEEQDFRDNGVDETLDICPPYTVAVAVLGDKAAPGTIIPMLELLFRLFRV